MAQERHKWDRFLTPLARSLRDRQLAVVVGAGLSKQARLPTWSELIDALRAELQPIDPDSADISSPLLLASMYEAQFDRQGLVRRVHEFLPPGEPSPAHHALADLDVEFFFTTNFDSLLEDALQARGRNPYVIKRDVDYAHYPKPGVAKVFKMNGDLDLPSDLVITENDFARYAQSRPNLLQELQRTFKTHTVLFIGISFEDPALKSAYYQALQDLGKQGRRAYVVWDRTPALARRAYAQLNLEVVDIDCWDNLIPFLQRLRQLAAQADQSAPPLTAPAWLADTDIRDLLSRLTEAEAQRMLKTFRRLAEALNAGYRSKVERELQELVSDIENKATSLPIPPEVPARVHRLAAAYHLPRSPRETPEASLAQISEALRLWDNAGHRAECRVIQALARQHVDGLEATVTALRDIGSSKARAVEFSLYAHAGHIEKCHEMLEARLVDAQAARRDPDLAPALAYYYALSEEFGQAEETTRDLLNLADTPSHREVAADIARLTAYAPIRQFCKRHGLLPNATLGLDLAELAGGDALERCLESYTKAVDGYLAERCEEEAVATLEAAVRALRPSSEPVRGLAERLAELSPRNPVLCSLWDPAAPDRDLPARPPDFQTLQRLAEDPHSDTALLLEVAGGLGCQELIADRPPGSGQERMRQVVEKLDAARSRFDSDPGLQAGYTLHAAQLWRQAGDAAKASEILEGYEPPQQYAYLAPLLRAMHYSTHDLEKALNWLDRASALSPENPQVLFVAVTSYGWAEETEKQAEAATKLARLLRTRQTVRLQLQALADARRWAEFLAAAEQAADDAPEDEFLRPRRANALLALDRGEEAIEDLEWMRQGRLGGADALLALARAYALHRNDYDRALQVAHECTERFPDERDGYLYACELALHAGRTEDAFQAAAEALERFPDEEEVLVKFIHVAHRTGHDGDTRLPNVYGRLSAMGSGHHFRVLRGAQGLDEAKRLVLARHEATETAEALYAQGVVPLILIAEHPLGVALYGLSRLFLRHGTPRYISCGDQAGDFKWLSEHAPNATVIDYTALLTLEALSDEKPDAWLEIPEKCFQTIYVPSSFHEVLAHERDRLADRGQPSRYRSLVQLRNAIERERGVFETLPHLSRDGAPDTFGEYTERQHASQHSLPYFAEYPQSDYELQVPELNLAAVTELLRSAGEIDKKTHDHLLTLASRPIPQNPADPATVAKQREVVADLTTLERMADANALTPLTRYFSKICISEQALDRLRAEIEQFEFDEQCRTGFERFTSQLRASKATEWVSLEPDERVAMPPRPGTEERLDPYFRYYADLYNVALKQGTPLWTDDRATRAVSLEAGSVPRFGTDSLLKWAFLGRKAIDDNTYFALYERMLDEFRYRCLLIEPEFVVRLYGEVNDPRNERLVRILRTYREAATQIQQLSQDPSWLYGELTVRRAFRAYVDGVAAILDLAHQRGLSPESAGDIFAELDLSRHWEHVRGREPEFLSLLFLRYWSGVSVTRQA